MEWGTDLSLICRKTNVQEQSERPLAEDFADKVTVFLPPSKAVPVNALKWRLPPAIQMMKHVLQGDRVPGMVVQRQPKESEQAVPTIVDLWHDAVPTESLTGHGPLAEYVVPTQTTDNVELMK